MSTLDDVYCKFGEVAEAAQLLEVELGNMLLRHGIDAENLVEELRPERAAELFNQVNRKTLGQLVRSLPAVVASVDGLDELLSSALRERNRLNHSFYREHNFRRNSSTGCALMLSDLATMHTIILDAYRALLLISGVDLSDDSTPSLPTGHLPI